MERPARMAPQTFVDLGKLEGRDAVENDLNRGSWLDPHADLVEEGEELPRSGGAAAFKSRGGYALVETATQNPIARLKPEGPGDQVRTQNRTWQNRWKDVGDMCGLVLPLGESLDTIAKTEVF